MAKYNQVTQSMFNCVKRLTEGGAPVDEICDYLKISATTVQRIRRAESLEEYKSMTYVAVRAARANKSPEPETEPAPQVQEVIHKHEQSVTLVANHYMAEELRKQTELLTLISNKLAFIVDELTGTGSASSTGV